MNVKKGTVLKPRTQPHLLPVCFIPCLSFYSLLNSILLCFIRNCQHLTQHHLDKIHGFWGDGRNQFKKMWLWEPSLYFYIFSGQSSH